jgi:hypothetical protein
MKYFRAEVQTKTPATLHGTAPRPAEDNPAVRNPSTGFLPRRVQKRGHDAGETEKREGDEREDHVRKYTTDCE